MTAIEKQFHDLKAKHPDAVLLFRCGDFYECREEDAEKVSKILGIILSRHTASQQLFCGFPYHALDTYLPKLIRAGLRVAICDQLEDPKLTKKLVKRGITELVQPPKVQLPALTRKQYDLLCECIRYRCADNSRERTEAESHGQSTTWYDDMAKQLQELKSLIYDIKPV